MIRTTERIRCPYCGFPVGFLGQITIPKDNALVAVYSTLKGSPTVQVTVEVVAMQGPLQRETLVDVEHYCPNLQPVVE